MGGADKVKLSKCGCFQLDLLALWRVVLICLIHMRSQGENHVKN